MNPPTFAPAWRLILETALDAVVVMDSRGYVIDWNDNATAIFGWPQDEMRGRLMADFIIPERFREAHAHGLRHYLATGEANVLGRRIEIWGLRRTGEEFPVELSISPVSENGSLIFVGFLRDISNRRNAERQREQHALKMETLYRAISFAAENNSFEDALEVCLASIQKLTGWPLAHVFMPSDTEPVRLLPADAWLSTRPEEFGRIRAATEASSFAPGEGLPGRVWASREPEWIADVNSHDVDFPRARWPGGIEVKSVLGFPIISDDKVVAVLEFFSDSVEQPDSELLPTLHAIGQQLGRVFERRRGEQQLRERAAALEAEIEERKRAEEHQKFLLAEVNHRVKNMLAVVTAIAAQTGRTSSSIKSFNQNFLARLRALDGAHGLLTRHSWREVSMTELAEVILSPYSDPAQLHVSGGLLMLPPKAVLSIGLVLHELVTNAAKHGALSIPTGQVSLQWGAMLGSEQRVNLQWVESGVGEVAPPTRTGFGSSMIRASVQHDLKGSVNVRYGDDGIHYSFDFPLKMLEEV